MAFDYGLHHIGVAVGNTLLASAQGIAVLKARDGSPDWQQVANCLQEWQPQLLLVGDPLNMDDSVSELAQRARKFGRRLEGRFNLPVEMVDERLSSFEAKQQAAASGHRGDYLDQPIDALAAEIILQTWMAECN